MFSEGLSVTNGTKNYLLWFKRGKIPGCCYISKRQYLFKCTKKTNPFSSEIHQKRICITDVLSAVCHSSIFSCIRHSLHIFLSMYATCKARFLDLNTFQIFLLFYLTQQIFYLIHKKISRRHFYGKKKNIIILFSLCSFIVNRWSVKLNLMKQFNTHWYKKYS